MNAAFRALLATLLSCAFPFVSLAQERTSEVWAERDLALMLPADAPAGQAVFASERPSPLAPLFEKKWYDAVLAAFARTSAGEAPALENGFEDWRLVSLRVVPCNPVVSSFAANPEVFCWPELRLVWQPVVVGGRVINRPTRFYADDRAIHALYDVAPELLGNADEAAKAKSLLGKIRMAPADAVSPLQGDELTTFVSLRNRVALAYLREARALRPQAHFSADYAGFGVRPEFGDSRTGTAFVAALREFLARHAQSESIKELTAFSLPEGRQPPLLDEWVFLAFEGKAGTLRQKDITLRSARDGRLLFNFGKSPVGSQRRDAPSLQTALDGSGMSGADAEEIRNSVMTTADARGRLRSAVSDRRRVLVPNTSCASCHKMNALAFDFHNLSYLEDADMTVSPRVVRDVELDLAWINSALR